jgi:hypothetical protein
MTVIELADRSYPRRATRTETDACYQSAWRRTTKVFCILLNAVAMLEGSQGSLEAGALSEDDRRLRALSLAARPQDPLMAVTRGCLRPARRAFW